MKLCILISSGPKECLLKQFFGRKLREVASSPEFVLPFIVFFTSDGAEILHTYFGWVIAHQTFLIKQFGSWEGVSGVAAT